MVNDKVFARMAQSTGLIELQDGNFHPGEVLRLLVLAAILGIRLVFRRQKGQNHLLRQLGGFGVRFNAIIWDFRASRRLGHAPS